MKIREEKEEIVAFKPITLILESKDDIRTRFLILAYLVRTENWYRKEAQEAHDSLLNYSLHPLKAKP